MSMRLCAVFAIAVPACLLAQNSASGILIINKDRFDLKYVSAAQAPDTFDKSKLATRIVVADKPIPPEVMDDEAQIWDLKSQGFHGMEITLGADHGNIAIFLISPTLEGSISNSGTFDPQTFPVLTAKRVEGIVKAAQETLGSNTYSYNVKIAADVVPAETVPTAADAAAAAGKESTRAYLALVAAIRAGNKEQILALGPPERRAQIDTPEFPQMLKMVQSMTPRNIKVLKATESGDKAQLVVTGVQEGKTQHGKVYLIKQGGKWLVTSESWGGG